MVRVFSFLIGALRWLWIPLAAFFMVVKGSVQWKTIKPYIPYIIALLGGAYAIYQITIASNKKDVESLSGDSGKPNRLALLLVNYMGTNKTMHWLHPARWNADESASLDLLEQNIDIAVEIANFYNELSESGSLFEDVQSRFNTSELERFNKIFE